MNRTLIFAAAFLLLIAGVLTLVTAISIARRSPPVASQSLGSEPDESPPAPPATGWLTEYTLTERSGRSVASSDLAGQVHVVNFFFASCPSYCRMQSTQVQELANVFGPQGVVFLSITCDPDNDSPQALQQYASMFNADPDQWLFLTGDLLLLRRVGAEMYQLAVAKETHTEHLVVVDRWGKVRGRYRWRNHPEELEEMKLMLAKLLAETEPPPEEANTPAATPPADDTDEDAIDGPHDAVDDTADEAGTTASADPNEGSD